jgi:DNA-binding GntR family transcriptional regulator
MGKEASTYARIADDLRRRITSGELPTGALLPTQKELAESYQVARMTARQAISELVNEGLVTSKQGKGATVRERHQLAYRPQAEYESRTSAIMDRYMSSLSQEGREPSQRIEILIEPAPPVVAKRLEIDPGALVAVRRRTRFINKVPFNINDTYYDYELARDTSIMNPADIPRGSNYVIPDTFGWPETRAIDEFYIRMPNLAETERLQLSRGTPVACHYVTGYTENDKPIRCDLFILPGDRHVIVYERLKPGPD